MSKARGLVLEMSTNWLPLIQPGTYGTNLGDIEMCVSEEYMEDFKKQLCVEACSIMNEIFSEDWFVEKFGNVVTSNGVFKSPQFYNFENDSIEFDLEIVEPKRLLEDYYGNFEKWELWDIEWFEKFMEKNYGSHPGFISFFPTSLFKFIKALESEPNKKPRYEFNMAVSMLIMFAVERSKCALDSYQKDFEDNISEYCSQNGLFEDYEEYED